MYQPGLKGVVAVQTRIASVDGEKGELRYRGKLVQDVIEGRSFEEVAFYLWNGRFPSGEELTALEQQLLQHRELPEYVADIAEKLPVDMPLMDGMRTLISSFSAHRPFIQLPVEEQAIALTASLPVMTSILYRKQNGMDAIQPDRALSHTANFLWMLFGEKPSQTQTEALETYLKLTMEHGMNASTFAARVTISTESDLVSAVTSALGTMKGPLHGGAPSGVIELLEEVQEAERVRSTVLQKLENGERIMGFGHRVYRTDDPRSILLRQKCLELQGNDQWLDLAVEAEKIILQLLAERKPGRALRTNVEYYAAAIMRSIHMPPQLFTPTFSIARIVGWSAHAIEQQKNNVLFRPQSEYIGETEKAQQV